MFALGVIGIVEGLAWFVLLVEACLLFGDYGLSVFCAVVAGLSTWAAAAIIRSRKRRMDTFLTRPAAADRTISTSRPPAKAQWVVSACQHSLGNSAWNRRHELPGRLWRWG
jgi:hypothetical protein